MVVDSTALVDGKPTPCVLTANQALVLFPTGLSGLQESFGERAHVFPDVDGTVRLTPGMSYVLERRGMTTWPCRAPNQVPPQKPKSWAPHSSTAAVAAVPSVAQVGERYLFRLPEAPPDHASQFLGETLQASSACGSRVGTQDAITLYNVGKASSIADDDVACHTTEYTDEFSGYSPQAYPSEGPGKLIQDRVHEYVFLPTIAIRIIDTFEFQRLRSLKQLGTTVFLYPGATHTRFEHSIGVAHLASEMVQRISFCQPELGITKADITSVTIAGLCHDIGHGPFSHLFEHLVNRMRVGTKKQSSWHHEEMSIRLLRRILSRIDLGNFGLSDEDARFMELCITGLAPRAPWPSDIGRPPSKRFLVDIVANKRNGLDVDKLDYFLRDSLGCYGRAALDVHIPRLLNACKVMCFEGEYQICFEEKMALSLGEIFNVRAKLHKHTYQHRIVKVTDCMVSDALLEADPYFTVRGKDGRLIRMSECVEDEEGFCQLGDWVCNAISASGDTRLAKAQAIIRRINERDLYPVIGVAMFARYHTRTTEQYIHEEILNYCINSEDKKELREAVDAALIVTFISITFGSSDDSGVPDDPIDHVTFYNPKNTSFGAFKLPRTRLSPLFSPCEYGERMVLVMVRDRAYMEIVTAAFEAWRDHHDRLLGVAVPTHNMRKDESPGKSSSLLKRWSEISDNGNGAVQCPSFVHLSGLSQDDTSTQEHQGSQKQQEEERQQELFVSRSTSLPDGKQIGSLKRLRSLT